MVKAGDMVQSHQQHTVLQLLRHIIGKRLQAPSGEILRFTVLYIFRAVYEPQMYTTQYWIF